MAPDLVSHEQKARKAVKVFWRNRAAARKNQIESGKANQGERAGVTAGKNMDGFLALLLDVIRANGLATRRHTATGQYSRCRVISARPSCGICW